MTKTEFYLQALLHIAENPKFHNGVIDAEHWGAKVNNAAKTLTEIAEKECKFDPEFYIE